LTDFREQYPTNIWAAAPFWVTSASGKFLLTLDSGYQTTNNSTPDTFYRLLIFPEDVMDKVVNSAVVKSGVSIPSYALIEWEIGGRKTILS
jgi:hypothetical protein